jgi:flagellar protein FliS
MLTSAFAPASQAHRAAGAYTTVDAQSRTPFELVIMLYDGAIRFAGQALDADRRGDRRGRAVGVSRTLAIVSELQNTLDIKRGGDIATELDRLYHYITTRLLEVTRSNDSAPLVEVLRLLATLRDGWLQASSSANARS